MDQRQVWKLWYRKPASKWEEALPLGNGRLGAMVFGGACRELIQWNEDTLWSGFPRDTNNYEALRHLSAARERIASGRYAEAERLIEDKMLGRNSESFLPLGDLRIEQTGLDERLPEYRRTLDLDTGIASVEFWSGRHRFRREMFISVVDQVAVIHFSSSTGSEIHLNLALDSPLKHETGCTDSGKLRLFGQAPTHIADNCRGDHPAPVLYEDGLGLRYELRLAAQTDGGHIAVDQGSLNIARARSVMLLLAAATNFEGFQTMPGAGGRDPARLCEEWLEAAAVLGYEPLRTRHVEDHQALFRRVELELGTKSDRLGKDGVPTDQRLADYARGAEDPSLEALMFQYGRYLLMASSRSGNQPAHLQGLWNPHVQPPWNSNYTTNINTQMNYWPAETANLRECHEPLIEMIRELAVTGARTAKIHYNARGWAVHHNVDLWRTAGPSGGKAMWAFWPMAGPWLCRHLWEHYRYHPDLPYLRETAYPLMRGAALFCLDWLVEDGRGHLLTSPSTSPENLFLTADGVPCAVSAGSTLDMALIRELFRSCIEASRLLETDKELREKMERALARLLPYRVDAGGRLMEWSEPFPEAEPGHRHVSHLYGLYPGCDMNLRDTPQLAAAAAESLKVRIDSGSGHTGWSCAWLINLFARLRQPQQAYRYIRTLLTRSVHPNLFGDHPPFQIDANFGGAAGLAEMLLQSHLDEIELLPALPPAWKSGRVGGLKARGGFLVSMEWNDGKLQSATITSTHGQNCRIRCGIPVRVEREDGTPLTQGELCAFETIKGFAYVIVPLPADEAA
ncbi:glycoside hydrolase family 95 protein [Paenibacillus ehimensis]|uniref:glycoside hydrolase family 95 protein n=1 Tax=Paenibacillus ehimensis TaxID=79264 RepID=UPI0027D88619|nr:glycoside hydrolase family 95 protein [Paenibacillus ehimensis]